MQPSPQSSRPPAPGSGSQDPSQQAFQQQTSPQQSSQQRQPSQRQPSQRQGTNPGGNGQAPTGQVAHQPAPPSAATQYSGRQQTNRGAQGKTQTPAQRRADKNRRAPEPPANWEKGKPTAKDKRRGRALAREERWNQNRFAVPYRTDGPKITFGILWFAMIVGAALLGVSTGDPAVGSLGIAVVGAPIAGLAALQTAHAWFPTLGAPRLWMASAAYLIALAGFFAIPGVIIGFAFGVLVVSLYVLLYRGHQRPPLQLFDILARSAIPAGIAIASMAAIAKFDVSALVSLILLISAYEAGDFLVGTGSSNAVEGPLAGLVALGTVAFLLFLTLPPPFSESTVLLFALLTGVCCPLGQILASALLPRGAAWAPALRRIDSYLIAAPLWMVLLDQIPTVG